MGKSTPSPILVRPILSDFEFKEPFLKRYKKKIILASVLGGIFLIGGIIALAVTGSSIFFYFYHKA